MELIYFLLYIALVMALVFWFRRILERDHGITELNWKMTLMVYCAAFGVPSVVLALLSILIKIAYFILL
jgi:hypothetical protein